MIEKILNRLGLYTKRQINFYFDRLERAMIEIGGLKIENEKLKVKNEELKKELEKLRLKIARGVKRRRR